LFYILYALAAILAVLKLLGEISISWWLIVGLAAVPLFLTLAALALAFAAAVAASR
jgi:hypothetical protein